MRKIAIAAGAALVLVAGAAAAGDMLTITAAFQPGQKAYEASNKVQITSPRGGTVTRYEDHTPSCGVARVIMAYSRDGKSVSDEPEFMISASAPQFGHGPRPPLLVGAHLAPGWYKFVPMAGDSKTYCRGTIYVRMD